MTDPVPVEAATREERDRVATLRVAIAGAGGFIGRVHARSARLAGAAVVGVSASTAERSREVAGELGVEQAFASSEELATADDVDVVHICTPNHLHVPLALRALEAGKHVICEKPVAVSAAEAAALPEAVERAGTVFAVPFVYRYYPMVREARERVAAGQLSAMRLLRGAYLQDWLAAAEDDNWRVDSDLGGASRAFADIGSHWCDLVEFVSGQRIARMSARTVTALPERLRRDGAATFASGDGGKPRPVTTEDIATVMFETDGGAAGSMVVSQVSPGYKNRLTFELHGAEATISFDQERPETIEVGRRSAGMVLQRDPAGLAPAAGRYATLPPGHPQGYHDCFDAFVADAYEAIRGGSPDGLPGVADGTRAARITDAVLESARTGAWVEVPA